MTTLREHFGTNTSQSYGDIGLEVETEYSKNVIDEILRTIPLGWTPHRDNSLRNNGIEYTTNGPIRMADKYNVLKALIEFLAHLPVRQSPRTSVHVHINVLDKTPVAVATAITAYWILEDILFEMCGKYRRGNLFCLSVKDAYSVVHDLVKDIRDSMYYRTFTLDNHKYGALNLATISRYGTLEVRGMNGNLNLEHLNTWVDLLYEIVSFSSSAYKNPQELLEKIYKELYVRKSPLSALKCLISRPHLQDVVFDLVGKDEGRLGRSLMDGVILCRPIAYNILDWERVYTQKNKKRSLDLTRNRTAPAPALPRGTRGHNNPTLTTQDILNLIREDVAVVGGDPNPDTNPGAR